MCGIIEAMDTVMVSVTLSYDEEIDQWGAWLPDVAAFGQGDTPQAAIEDLKKALALYIEEVGYKKFVEELAPPAQSLSLPLSDLVEAA